MFLKLLNDYRSKRASRRLFDAIRTGDEGAVLAALEGGLDPNAIGQGQLRSDPSGRWFAVLPLESAVEWAQPRIIEALFAFGARSCPSELMGVFPMLEAAPEQVPPERAFSVLVALTRGGYTFLSNGPMTPLFQHSTPSTFRRIQEHLKRMAPDQGWSMATVRATAIGEDLAQKTPAAPSYVPVRSRL